MSLTLVIGNKAYSSWSMRPWLALKMIGVPFAEEVIPLDQPDTRERCLQHSPSGRVPVLKDGSITVWDSLAILEYLNEAYPNADLWPRQPPERAMARSIAAEMHAGFAALRRDLTMNIRRSISGARISPEAQADIARIQELWHEARTRHGQAGPFLFGAFTAADAMYAPVVTRFQTYRVPVTSESRAYMDAVLALPAVQEWYAAAAAEPWTIGKYEL